MAIIDKVKFGLLPGLLAAVFGVIAFAVATGKTMVFDLEASNLIYSLRTPLLTKIILGVSFLGSTPFIAGAAMIIVLEFWMKNRRKYAFILALTLLTSVAINNILKYSIRRFRPVIAPLDTGITYGFPSGHAMNSLVFYFLLAYLLSCRIKSKWLFTATNAGLIILVVLIGISRIYLGAHYPTDVIAGFAAGLFVFCAAIIFKKGIFGG